MTRGTHSDRQSGFEFKAQGSGPPHLHVFLFSRAGRSNPRRVRFSFFASGAAYLPDCIANAALNFIPKFQSWPYPHDIQFIFICHHVKMSSHPPLRSHSRQTSLVNHPSRLRQSHAADSDPAPDSFVDEPTTLRHSEESTGSTLVNAATSARDRLVDGYFRISARSSCNNCGTGDCEHGILSPQIFDHSNPKRRSDSYGGKLDSHGNVIHSVLGDAVADGLIGGNVEREDHGENGETNKMSTTDWLARRHGITGRRSMYVVSTLESQLHDRPTIEVFLTL